MTTTFKRKLYDKQEKERTAGKTCVQEGRNTGIQSDTGAAVHRGINDIGTWKSALRAADMGLRSKLYDLYEDILMDGTVTDAIGKRIEAITDCDINFTVNRKEVPR